MAAMNARSGASGYDTTARTLHWITAALVLFMLPAGAFMVYGPEGPVSDALYELHRSFGFLLLLIIIVRAAWRARHPAPPLPADIPALQKAAAHIVHGALYGLLLIQPPIGWVATSAYRAPMELFWIIPLPPIWPEDRAFSDWLFTVHRGIGIAIAVLVVMHLGAVGFHTFIRRDDVLMRMVRG